MGFQLQRNNLFSMLAMLNIKKLSVHCSFPKQTMSRGPYNLIENYAATKEITNLMSSIVPFAIFIETQRFLKTNIAIERQFEILISIKRRFSINIAVKCAFKV